MRGPVSRVGETRKMSCGMNATIIEYRRNGDIDVQFEDGTISKRKTYNSFKHGNIRNINIKTKKRGRRKINRVGETRVMSSGMQAKIIAYRGATDIDVQFEDGTIARNRNYGQFLNGYIRMTEQSSNGIKDRTGETRTMHCGMKATIIRYKNINDIDVQFEDGAIAVNRIYRNFKMGSIAHPCLRERVGETRMMNCGMKATIIEYYTSDFINVEFEDGTVVKDRTYDCFKKGNILNPTIGFRNLANNIATRTGETRMMNCGMNAKIIVYRRAIDIDVQFDDGTVAEHKTYNCFKKGSISNPSLFKKNLMLKGNKKDDEAVR